MGCGAAGGVGYNLRMDNAINAILVIEVIGFGVVTEVVRRLWQQIGALKGTVDAQKATLETVRELNKIAVEMARAADPKRYLDMVETNEKLVQKNATAAMEDMRRELERERQQSQEEACKMFDMAMRNALQAGFELVAYVAPDRRPQAIAAMPPPLQEAFSKVAADAPDLSGDFSTAYRAVLGAALKITLDDTIVVTAPVLPSPPTVPPELRLRPPASRS
jgi:hypothetical protein